MDTYDQRREFLTDVDQSVEKALEMLGVDPAKRNLAERIDAAGRTIGTVIANARIRPLDLSDRDIQVLLEMIKNPPAPNEKLKQAVLRYQSASVDSQTSDTKSISEIVDTE